MTMTTANERSTSLRAIRARQTPHANASSTAYWVIREAIRTGIYQPGERLIELDLAADLEMSRTPVREALRRLASEQLLASSNGRGYEIPTTTLEDLIDVYELRGALEGLAAKRAAQRMSTMEFDALQSTVERMQTALDTNDPATLSAATNQFHRLIRDRSRNDRLGQTLALLVDSLVGTSVYEMAPERAKVAIAEHQQICDAITARDVTEAERLMRVHIENALRAQIKAQHLQGDG